MILTNEDHPHLRLRRNGERLELTKKYPKSIDSSLEMIEETIKLNEKEFAALKKLESSKQSKIRYNYRYNNIDAEIDIWTEDLEGLAIIEFEVTSKEIAETLEIPDFCLVEITNIEWLAGGKLSGKKYAELTEKLEEFGYKPLKINFK